MGGLTPDAITITPISFIDGKIVEGKTHNLKFKTTETSQGFFSHEIPLPKVSKNSFQLYRLDFVIKGKTVSRIVGNEQLAGEYSVNDRTVNL